MGHPFTLYSISHFGYHYIELVKLETYISKGEPDRINLQITDGLKNFQRFGEEPRVLFTKKN